MGDMDTDSFVDSVFAMMDYDVYLRDESTKEIFHFPVNPLDAITVNHSKKYDTMDIINFGEVDDIKNKGKKINEISFNTFFPKVYDSSYCRYTDIPDPIDAMAKLLKWQDSENPQRLIITGFGFDDLVIIDSIDEEERSGEVKDKYATFKFRTHRELKVELYKPPDSSSSALKNNRAGTEPAASNNSRVYVVKGEDTLWSISKWWWGDGSKWMDIYNKNKSVIGPNPNLIYSGEKLIIP